MRSHANQSERNFVYFDMTGFKMQGKGSFTLLICLFVCVLPHCTKPKVHVLRPIALISPDSRELFGCRINGKPFSPAATDSASLGNCTYLRTYEGSAGFTFQISANQHENSCRFSNITITLDSIELKQDKTYRLGTPGLRKNYASYLVVGGCGESGKTIYTADDLYGEVTITRLDVHKGIANGTFDFKMRDEFGNIIRMSDGIFDRHYTD